MDCAWFIEKLIAKLKLCPCCRAEASAANKPEDGIPDEMVHETVFGCGARVQITKQAELVVGAACPYPLDDELFEIKQSLEEECDL